MSPPNGVRSISTSDEPRKRCVTWISCCKWPPEFSINNKTTPDILKSFYCVNISLKWSSQNKCLYPSKRCVMYLDTKQLRIQNWLNLDANAWIKASTSSKFPTYFFKLIDDSTWRVGIVEHTVRSVLRILAFETCRYVHYHWQQCNLEHAVSEPTSLRLLRLCRRDRQLGNW
jgi:hypothetical protein